MHNGELFQLLRGRKKGRRPQWLRRAPAVTRELVADANIVRLVHLEEEAIGFLQEVREAHSDLPLVVSWSGGKDSTVASMLAQRAFAHERIPHVFADTTIELPSTYEFLREFRRLNPAIPFLVGLPARGFFELCREIGPPSRIQRWCCTTHKAAPLTDILRVIGRSGQVLVVGGLRRSESTRRGTYPRVIDDGKIGLQVLLSPIAEWSDFDVWMWILRHAAPVNRGYRLGLDRVGCAFCPDSGDWTEMIAVAAFHDHYGSWLRFLFGVAQEAGVREAAEYVASGAWKNRRGGGIGAFGLRGIRKYDVATVPCASDDCSVSYELSDHFSLVMLAELLKPFGAVSVDSQVTDIGHYHVAGPYGVFAVRAVPHWKRVRVTFETRATRKRLEGALRLQMRKLQACVGCGACAALCPQGAVVSVAARYTIAEERCLHCLRCVRGLKAGCRVAHSVNVKLVVSDG